MVELDTSTASWAAIPPTELDQMLSRLRRVHIVCAGDACAGDVDQGGAAWGSPTRPRPDLMERRPNEGTSTSAEADQGVNILTRRRNVLSSLHLRHSAAHREKRKESTMRGLTVRVTLAVLALVATLYLPTQRVGVAEAQTFNLEKAVTEAKTPADHEALASY